MSIRISAPMTVESGERPVAEPKPAASILAEATIATRPDNVPEKFWDAATGSINTAALLTSYGHLEAKQGAAAKPAAPALPGVPTPTEIPTAPAIPQVPGLEDADMARYGAEWAADGKLTAASYAELQAKGIPATMVDQFAAGQAALAATRGAEIMAHAGGTDGYTAMVEWARDNLSAAEQATYNAAVKSAGAESAVKGLAARFAAETSQPPATRIAGAASSAPGETAYKNMREYIEDCGKPEYSTSEQFRGKCWAKLQASKF